MTYDTGNPLGSSDARDLLDNAANLDTAMHSEAETWTDRFGVSRKTLSSALSGIGYDLTLGDYGAEKVFMQRNQVILYSGEYYKVKASAALPFTTTGVWLTDSASLVGVGDAVLRQDLIDDPHTNFSLIPEIGTYALLRAYAGPVTSFYVRGVANIFDGGAGVFRVHASDTTSADNSCTILVDAVGRRWKRELQGSVNVEWAGASSLSPDNTVAINAAGLAASAAGCDLMFPKIYACTGVPNIPDFVICCGRGKYVSGITGSGTSTLTVGTRVQFADMKIFNTNPIHVCVTATSKHSPQFDRCYLNGRVNCLNYLNSEVRGPRVENCVFDVDFGSDYNGVDQMDLFGVYGCYGSRFINNEIQVANVHRIWKLTDGLYAPNSNTPPSMFNTRDVIIRGNTIRGYGGKQVIDAYIGTSSLYFVENDLDLPDTACFAGAGVKFTTVVECKTGTDQRDPRDMGSNLFVQGNTGSIACAFVGAYGCYGITEAGHVGDRFNTLKLFSNNVRRVVDSATPLVTTRFFNDVFSDGNTFQIPTVANRTIVEFLSNQNLTIGDKEVYRGGVVSLSRALVNPDLWAFSGKSGSIRVGACEVLEYDGSAAILATSLDADYVKLSGHKSRPAASPTQSVRAFNFTSTVGIARLDITDVDATHPSGGTVTGLLDAMSTAALGIYRDCNWQPRFRGYASAIPTSGTYLRGDTIRNSSPNAGTAAEWTCISSGTPGTWRCSKFIPNKSSTAGRPTLTANDVGAGPYLDTTLDADGKPIWWTGTAWVDATGATV